jgi:sucrose phosphorylase
LVYNFALPPLVLHALLRGDATYLTRWAATLRAPSKHTTFFNFLASHDGIGLNPARGILPETEINHLVERCLAHGGFISYKHNSDGSKSPYEMNIVYFDALNHPDAGESLDIQVSRFLAAQAVMLALAGVPGIYFHSLFGSRNDRAAALTSGINRRINRHKLNLAELEAELANEESLRYRVFSRFRHLLQLRRAHPAFNPQSDQQILDLGKSVFAVLRTAQARDNRILCLHNLSDSRARVEIDSRHLAGSPGWNDLLAGESVTALEGRTQPITLEPYQVKWLAPTPPSTAFPNRR